MKRRNDKATIIFASLIFLIIAPLYAPGYVSTLDMVFTPNLPMQPWSSPSFLLYFVLHSLSLAIPVDIIQKGLLTGILVLSAVGAYYLVEKNRPKDFDQATWQWGSLFAGVFYLCNPFTYTRLIAGQFELMIGYALLPFFVYTWQQFLARPGKKPLFYAILTLTAISIASLHMLGIAVIIAAVFGVTSLISQRHNYVLIKKLLLGTLAGGIGFILVSSYWLIPLLAGKGRVSTALSSFGVNDRIAFATHGQDLGVIGNVLSLRGFWGEAKNLFLVPQDVFNWWLIPVIILWLLIITGVVYSIRKQRVLSGAFLIVTILGVVLASGTSGSVFGGFNGFITEHIPFFNGYREPQKFTALIAVAFAYYGCWGIVASIRALQRKYHSTALAIGAGLCVIPLLLSPLMLWGFHGQLKPRNYPVDWYAINDRLKAEAGEKKTLFLPWHLYMRFSYADRIIANPAKKFFETPMIISSNPELSGAKSYATTEDQEVIEHTVLPAAQAGKKTLARDLFQRDIHYILLAKEGSFKKYDYLNSEPGIELLQETKGLKLYEIRP